MDKFKVVITMKHVVEVEADNAIDALEIANYEVQEDFREIDVYGFEASLIETQE